MQTLTIGFDDNLGIPSDLPLFCKAQYTSFHELTEIIEAFRLKKLAAAFVPVGTLPYIDFAYEIIAQATRAPDYTQLMTSIFCLTAPFALAEISKQTIGRVNQFCTTSYWAPQIYLMQHLPNGTLLQFVNTHSFQDMLFKVAKQTINSAMVWDIILKQNLTAAEKVHKIFSKNDLPAPVIIIQPELVKIFPDLTSFTSTDTHAFFNGFKAPDLSTIKKFLQDSHLAKEYFTIKIVKT